MGNWDDEESEEEVPVVVTPIVKPSATIISKKGKYADEDASDEEVKDDWDASDDEEELAKKAAANKPVGIAPPVRAKGITKQKIAEKEAADRARVEELAERRREDADPMARKLKEKAAILKSDMDNAAALFGTSTLDTIDPFALRFSTGAECTIAATALADQIISKFSKNPLYATFILELYKASVAPLRDVDVRKTASALTVVANEKQKEQKDAAGGKKKGSNKPALGASKTIGRADTGLYEESLDDSGDYDDFM